MTQKLARVAAPCLRQLRQGSNPASRACLVSLRHFSSTPITEYATAAAVVGLQLPVDHAPITKPPSARPVETRKSQLIRTYTSLLRTTPLILLFQHSNLTAVEWAAVRRELNKALKAVPPPATAPGGLPPVDVAPLVKMQVLRTNMFNVALKIVEFYDPKAAAVHPQTPRTTRGPLIHDLSQAAYESIRNVEAPANSAYAQVEPLMVGPLAALVMPSVSPAHLAAALSILAPVPGQFPAPTRKKGPGYHDPICQNGLAKLMLVGGRIEDKIFDRTGVNWVGGISGGLDGLRAQLVRVLEGAGLGITTALEGGSRSLWMTLESRKLDLEEKSGEKKPEV